MYHYCNKLILFYVLLKDVLHNSDKEILDFIILRFINNRNYYEGCTSGTWSDEEDEREKKILSNKNNITVPIFAYNQLLYAHNYYLITNLQTYICGFSNPKYPIVSNNLAIIKYVINFNFYL